MNELENEYVKVFVKLDKDEDGYPPQDWEELWAKSLGDGKYQIDNVPFYAIGVSSGDSVTAVMEDGKLVVRRVVDTQGHSTLRVVVHDKPKTEQIRTELKALNCATELSNISNFFSVDVPSSANYSEIVALLDRYEANEIISYEESALRHGLG